MKRTALFFTLVAASHSSFACLDGTEEGIFLDNFNDFSILGAPVVIGGNLTIYGGAGETVAINSSIGADYCILANTGTSYSVWEVTGVTGNVTFIQGSDGVNESFQVAAKDYPGEPGGFTDYVTFPANLTIVGGNQPFNVLIGGNRATGFDEFAAEYAGFADIVGNLTVYTSNYDDEVSVGGTSISGSVTVKTKGGNDAIYSDATYPPNWGVFLNVDTGSGNDLFDLGLENYLGGGSSIKMGPGNDVFAGVSNSASGPDYFAAQLITGNGRHVFVNMGAGDDISDYQHFDEDGMSFLVHDDGFGNDVSRLIADKINYNGGSGDDTLTVNQTRVGSKLNGASGNDVLNSSIDTLASVFNFENVFVNGLQQTSLAEVTASGDLVVDLYEGFSKPHPESVEGAYQVSITGQSDGSLYVSASFCNIFADSDACGTVNQTVPAGLMTRDLKINTNSTDVKINGVNVPRDFVLKSLRTLTGPFARAEYHGMSLDITDSSIGRNLSVRGQKHDDLVSIKNTTVDGFAKIDTVNGDDNLSVVGSTFNNRFVFNGSGGDDVACIQSSLFNNAISTTFGSGNDDLTIIDSTKSSSLGRLNLVGGAGIDVFYRHNAFRLASGSQPSGRQFIVIPQAEGDYVNCRGFTSGGFVVAGLD